MPSSGRHRRNIYITTSFYLDLKVMFRFLLATMTFLVIKLEDLYRELIRSPFLPHVAEIFVNI